MYVGRMVAQLTARTCNPLAKHSVHDAILKSTVRDLIFILQTVLFCYFLVYVQFKCLDANGFFHHRAAVSEQVRRSTAAFIVFDRSINTSESESRRLSYALHCENNGRCT